MQLNKVFVKENPQSILVYGPAKSGKTQLVAGLVKRGYKLLWLDLEHGVVPGEQVDRHLRAAPGARSEPGRCGHRAHPTRWPSNSVT